MKQFYLRLLMATACLLTTGSIMAHDFVVNGIYYNITDETNKTVEVTYENPSGNNPLFTTIRKNLLL